MIYEPFRVLKKTPRGSGSNYHSKIICLIFYYFLNKKDNGQMINNNYTSL